MKFAQLKNFLAVAERGSIRGAARALGLSPPALTKSLQQLEKELRVPLVTRTTRGVVLSEFGEAFLKRARLIDAESHKAVQEMAQMLGRHEGAVTVGVSPTPAIAILPRALIDYRSAFPAVRVNIVGGLYHSHLPRLRAGSMDFAIGPVPEAGLDGEFRSEALFRNEVVVAVRRGHPLERVRSLRDLAGAEWVLTGPGSQGPGAAIFDALRAHGIAAPAVMVQCDSFSVLHALVLRSDMICALPRQMVESQPLHGLVRALRLREVLPRYVVSLFQRADAPLIPAAEKFATLLRRQAHYLRNSAAGRAASS